MLQLIAFVSTVATTGVVKDGTTFAGLAWFVIDPVRAVVEKQGYSLS
jgi:hypothetical protein